MTKYVKYIGTSHYREITEAQWAALDPPVENRTLLWTQANGWTIPADYITDHAWPYIEADSELVVIDKDYRSSSDETGDVVTRVYPDRTTARQADDIDSGATPIEVPTTVEVVPQPADQQSGARSLDAEVAEGDRVEMSGEDARDPGATDVDAGDR